MSTDDITERHFLISFERCFQNMIIKATDPFLSISYDIHYRIDTLTWSLKNIYLFLKVNSILIGLTKKIQ